MKVRLFGTTVLAAILACSSAVADGIIAPGHVLGNASSSARTPTDSSIADVMTRAGIPITGNSIGPGSTLLSPSTNGGVLWDNNGVLGDSTNIALSSLALSSDSGLNFSPTGNSTNSDGPNNPATTYGALNVQATTALPSNREFLIDCGLTSTLGYSGGVLVGNGNGDKACGYFGIEGKANSGNIWSINTMLFLDAGSNGLYSAQGIELDVNNYRGDIGSGIGLAGLAGPPYVYGMVISGYNTNNYGVMGAYAVSCSCTSPIFHRGFVITGPVVSDAGFQDLSSATISLDIRGAHSYGIDETGDTTAVALRLKNSQYITEKNVAGTSDLRILAVDASNRLQLGQDVASIAIDVPITVNTIGANTILTVNAASSYSGFLDFQVNGTPEALIKSSATSQFQVQDATNSYANAIDLTSGALTLGETGKNVIISALAGSGGALVCANAGGALYRATGTSC